MSQNQDNIVTAEVPAVQRRTEVDIEVETSACKKEPWCVHQKGHVHPCWPTFVVPPAVEVFIVVKEDTDMMTMFRTIFAVCQTLEDAKRVAERDNVLQPVRHAAPDYVIEVWELGTTNRKLVIPLLADGTWGEPRSQP